MQPLEQRHKSQLELSRITNTHTHTHSISACLSLCVWPRLIHRLMFSERERIRVCPDKSCISSGYFQSSQQCICDYDQIKSTLHRAQ